MPLTIKVKVATLDNWRFRLYTPIFLIPRTLLLSFWCGACSISAICESYGKSQLAKYFENSHTLKSYGRLAANPSNPGHEVTFPPNYVNLYEQKPKAIKSFGIRISPLLESANIKPQNIEKHFTSNIPAWCMKPPEILFDLHCGKKSESNPHILNDDFRKMQSRYKNYQQIYTDGSKEDSKVGCAVISDNHSNMQRIPDDSSIFYCWSQSNWSSFRFH